MLTRKEQKVNIGSNNIKELVSFNPQSFINLECMKFPQSGLGNIKEHAGQTEPNLENKTKIIYKTNYVVRYESLRFIQSFIRNLQIVREAPVLKSYCGCSWITKSKDLIIANNVKSKSASIKGLNRCKSINCPECGPIILAEKRKEIEKALTFQSSCKLPTLMLTSTFSHSSGDDLKKTLPKLKEAKKHFFGSNTYKRHFRKDLNIVGGGGWKIDSFECTTGKNSDHPHYHTFIFPQTANFNIEYWIDVLKKQWVISCAAVGLYSNYKNGLDLHKVTPEQAKDYVTKLSLELTGFNTKIQKSNNVSMFGLVKEAMKNKLLVESILHDTVQKDFESEILNKSELQEAFSCMKKYVEYLEAIHGTNFIRWSSGLKNHFGINEKTDGEILEDEEKENKDVLSIDKSEAYKLNPYLGLIRHSASIGDYKNISRILHDCYIKKYTWIWKNLGVKKTEDEVQEIIEIKPILIKKIKLVQELLL